jgi:hypothetical protein
MMTCVTPSSSDLQPVRIPGYDGGPFTDHRGLLDEHVFWLSHLASCAHDEEAAEALFGPDWEATTEFYRRLHEAADWPLFTVPLRAGHRLHVVYRTFADDPGTDYLLYHPVWEQAEVLARDEGHFMGPALSWTELAAAAQSGMPGGSSDDPDARVLLLLPALGDEDLPDTAASVLAAALAARTMVDDPHHLADLLLAEQGQHGTARWTTGPDGTRTNDGRYSYRNPANPFALPVGRLARVSAALGP